MRTNSAGSGSAVYHCTVHVHVTNPLMLSVPTDWMMLVQADRRHRPAPEEVIIAGLRSNGYSSSGKRNDDGDKIGLFKWCDDGTVELASSAC